MGSGTNETLQDILNWSEELVSKNIECVVLEIKRMIVSVDDNKIEYIVFAFENVIQHIPIGTVEELLLNQMCCAAEEIYSTTLSGLDGHLECSVKLSQFDTKEASLFLLVVCNRIIHSMRIACENLCKHNKIKCQDISKFIGCAKLILEESFDYYDKNWETVPELNEEFYNEIWQFYVHFWKLITQIVEYDSSRREDVDLLSNLLCHLESDAKSSFLKPKLQLVECWKNILSLIDKTHNMIGIEYPLNFYDIIIHLCGYLIKELGDVDNFYQDCTNNKLQNIKIYNFLLKIVVKLCKIFKVELKKSQTELICLLLNLYKMSPTFLRAANFEQPVVSEINRQVIMASDPILSLLYNSCEFPFAVKEALEKNVSDNPYGCTMFLTALLKKLNNTGIKQLYFSCNFDVMDHLFIAYGYCHRGVLDDKFYAPGSAVTQIELKKALYDYVFSALAVFTLSLSPDEFSRAEQNFLRNTLQDNPWKAILASDLWCLVARYANVQLCHATLDALIAFLRKIDLNTARPEFTYLACLVRRLLQFCEPEYLDALVQNFPFQDNLLLWKYLGIQPISSCPPLFHLLTIKLKHWVESKNRLLEDYQYLETSLDTLAMSSGSNEFSSAAVTDLIPSLWSVEVVSPPSSVWINYICSLTSLTTVNIAKMEPHQISMVIQEINRILKKSHKEVEKYCIFLVVKSLFSLPHQSNIFQQSDIRLIVSIFHALLTSESSMISTMAILVFSVFARNPSFSKIVELIGREDVNLQNKLVNFIQKDFQSHCEEAKLSKNILVQYEHNCSTNKKYSSTICQNGLSHIQSDNLLEEALNRLENDSIFLADKENFLNSSQLNRIKSVVSTLKEMKL